MTDYFATMLRDCLGAPGARIARSYFPRRLTDDVRLHVGQCRIAAGQWGATEAHTPVAVTATHVLATAYGLVLTAEVSCPDGPPRYYLATGHHLFEPLADRVHDTPPDPGAAAVDCRLDHDLTSMWQFEAALRRLLDDYPVLELELAGAQ